MFQAARTEALTSSLYVANHLEPQRSVRCKPTLYVANHLESQRDLVPLNRPNTCTSSFAPQLARELKALGLKFGHLTPKQLNHLRSLYSKYRLEHDMSMLIAAELGGGWTSRQVTSLLRKHRLTGEINWKEKCVFVLLACVLHKKTLGYNCIARERLSLSS